MVKEKTIHSFFKRKRDDVLSEMRGSTSTASTPIENHPSPTSELQEHNQEQSPRIEPITFKSIEYLERDLDLRRQIWEYPVHQRDEVRRAYLRLGPMQPKLQNYKPCGPQGHQRRFKYSYFSLFPSWLEYSQSNGRAYCLFCFLFANHLNKRVGFDVFTVKGFENWKKVNNKKGCAFLTHIGSVPCSHHNNAMAACQALLNQPSHIENIIHVHHKQEIERNHLRLKTTISSVRWLTFQSCAFRDHDESIQSRNRGNFLKLIKLLAKTNPKVAEVVLGNAPYNSKYTSPSIQKEILSIYASKVRKHIRDEIGDSKFSIIVDETCDVAKREQMAVVFRFVDKEGVLQERFFDVIHVKNTKAVTLKEVLSFVLSNHSLDVQTLCGQGYDGSSNIRGEFNGLQALFLKKCPYAYYVYCYAHRLQLALVVAAKDVVLVCQSLEKLTYITNVVDSSAKRHDELHNAQVVELARMLAIEEIETSQGANQIGTLKRPGDTRWGSHLDSISSLLEMFNVVSSVLQKIGTDASAGSIRAEADTAFNHLISFEFVFVLYMMRDILEVAEMLSQALQKKSKDIVNAIHLVSSTKVLLQKMRDDGWESFFDKVIKFCESHGVDVPNMEDIYILRGGRARRQPDQFTKEHYFRVQIFLATIDTQLQELNYRFNEKVMELLSIGLTLVPNNGFRSFNAASICQLVEKYYPEDFTQQERLGLVQQLNHFIVDISNNADLKKIATLTELCRCVVETKKHLIYNLVDRLIRLLVTLLVSTASAERAFSTLKIIKTRLCNRMEDDFLANSLLVHIEGEIAESYTYDEIIQDFKNLKKRRAHL